MSNKLKKAKRIEMETAATRQCEHGLYFDDYCYQCEGDQRPMPLCHFTPMKYCIEDSDDLGGSGEWFECKHCGHVKSV